MATLIMKFGGTSVGSSEAITQAAAIVLQHAKDWDRLVVVVSAMSGVTDALLKGARSAAAGDPETFPAIAKELRNRHQATVDALLPPGEDRARLQDIVDTLLENYSDLCGSIHVLGEVTPRALDTISSLGERINARVVSALLSHKGARSEPVDATELIITDDKFQDAAPLMDLSRKRIAKRLEPSLAQGMIPVVTGFMAATEDGVTTTLGRGGSDFTAAILGDCLDADEVWTWTDVDGVMSADPRMVADARVIPVLSCSEVSELAYFGAKVLHPKTIRPIIERGIPLWVKNTFNPTCAGTRIVDDPDIANGKIKAVTTIEGLSMVIVEGRGMLGVPGIAARTFSAVANQGASVLMISQASSEQSICFVIRTQSVQPVIKAVEQEMALELARRDIDQIRSLDDVVIVTVVGAGMRDTPGIAASIFGALGQAGINVIAIAQGSSECSLSIIIRSSDALNAVQKIHREVILHG